MPRCHLRPILQRYLSHPLSGIGSNRHMCILMVYTDQPSSCYHRFWNIRAPWRAPSRTAWRTTFAGNPVDRKRLLAALLPTHHRHGPLLWTRNERRRTTGLGPHANLDCHDIHACMAGLLTNCVFPLCRAYLTRAEIALVLLSEIAIEQDEDFRPHLHVLLHITTLNSGSVAKSVEARAYLRGYRRSENGLFLLNRADSSSVLVRKESAHLMTFLLYSLALKHLTSSADRHSTEFGLLTNFIESLQCKEGEPLWPRERPTLNNPFIPSASMVAAFVNKGMLEFCIIGSRGIVHLVIR